MTTSSPLLEIATGQFFDELVEADGQARPGADSLLNFLQDLSPQVRQKKGSLEAAIKSQGISFLVYSDSMNIDRSWPTDLRPARDASLGMAPAEKDPSSG